MNSVWLASTSLIILYLGSRFHSNLIAERIFRLDPNFKLHLISLVLITIWLKRQDRTVVYTIITMGFLLSMTLWALLMKVTFGWSGLGQRDASLQLFFQGATILGIAIWILVEALSLLLNTKKITISKALDGVN